MKTQVKTTHINSKRKEFKSNQVFIQQVANLEDLDYYNFLFETGIQFLLNQYPIDSKYARLYLKYSRSVSFWQWWKATWKKEERELLLAMEENNMGFDYNFYCSDMANMDTCPYVMSSFQNNYLKHFKNGIN